MTKKQIKLNKFVTNYYLSKEILRCFVIDLYFSIIQLLIDSSFKFKNSDLDEYSPNWLIDKNC